MRTVDYSAVLEGSAGLAGLTSDQVGVSELALFRTFHDRRLQAGWEIEDWPEICPVEQRYFRALWDSTATYAAGAERYDAASGFYFQSLQAANLNHAPTIAGVENSAWWAQSKASYGATDWLANTAYAVGAQVRNPANNLSYQCITAHTSGSSFDATKFGVLTPFERFIAWAQVEDSGSAHTVIGEFLGAWDRDPRITSKTVPLSFDLTAEGATFVRARPSVGTVWLKFRTRRPALSGAAWDSTAVYTSGQQVYFVGSSGSGNFWTANATTAAGESPDTAAGKWDAVAVPYFLRGWLIEAGYADWLTGDGQEEKAARHEALAQGWLELEADKLRRQQGQNGRLQIAA